MKGVAGTWIALVVVFHVQILASYGAPAGQQQQQQHQQEQQQRANYWIERKAEFYRNTSFELSQDNLRLMGGKFSAHKTGRLPFWFDFELFKVVFKKSYPNAQEESARQRIFINTCVRTLKERVMYRILASNIYPKITGQADLVSVW